MAKPNKQNRELRRMSEQLKQAETGATGLVAQSTSFSGPLPSPEVMREYGLIREDYPDRIFAMAEREQNHRHDQETRLVSAHVEDVKRHRNERRFGQVCAVVVCTTAIITGGVTAAYGAEVAGGAIGAGGLASLVVAFIWGRPRDTQSDVAKEDSND